MSATNFCQNCGAKLEPGATFCGSCGNPVQPQQPPQQPQQPQFDLNKAGQQFSEGVNEVAGTFKQAANDINTRYAPAANQAINRIESGDAVYYIPKDTLQDKFTCFHGRLNRLPYFLRSIVIGVIYAIGMGVMEAGDFGVLIGLVVVVASAYMSITLGIRRLPDLDKSGWLVLLCLIPVVNFFVGLYMLFAKGTTGPNKYGPDPLIPNLG